MKMEFVDFSPVRGSDVTVTLSVRQLKALIRRTFDDLTEMRYQHDPHTLLLFRVQCELAWMLAYMERLMAKAMKRETPVRETNVWHGFKNVNLTSAEKEEFLAWDMHDDDLWLVFAETVMEGHKLSLTFNKDSSSFVAAFTGLSDSANEGYTMSAYAKDWYTALRLLLFKHVQICQGDWSSAADREMDNIG
jgi:hypothetical protein